MTSSSHSMSSAMPVMSWSEWWWGAESTKSSSFENSEMDSWVESILPLVKKTHSKFNQTCRCSKRAYYDIQSFLSVHQYDQKYIKYRYKIKLNIYPTPSFFVCMGFYDPLKYFSLIFSVEIRYNPILTDDLWCFFYHIIWQPSEISCERDFCSLIKISRPDQSHNFMDTAKLMLQ